MPTAIINGIEIAYQVAGSGPAVLMCAPGGFDATIEKWSTAGVWQQVRPLEAFTSRFTCVAYDRRESGASGGRVEKLTWALYADEGKGLLNHLGIRQAFVMGGCMGCSVAIAFATRYSQTTLGLVLHWPVGGQEWRHLTHERWLGVHAAYVKEHGLTAVVALAREARSFMKDFRAGPWASVIARDRAFAERFAAMNADKYIKLVETVTHTLYDRDTAPGAEPEELRALKVPTLIIPGDDPYHATSAALYLRDHIPRSEYWDGPVAEQSAEEVRERILSFLIRHGR